MDSSIPAATSQAASQSAPVIQPEFVPLPPKGGDPIFGLSRSFWYSAERAGLIQLRRIRRPGCLLGRTLLPIPQARAAIEKMGTSGKHRCNAFDSAA